MSEWIECSLSDVIDIIGGGTPKTSVSEYWGGIIPWLSVVDFNTGKKYVYDTEKKITELGLEKSSTKYLNQNDIIISARGTVGVVAMLDKPMTFNQSCYGIRAKQDKSTNDYIYYLLKDAVKHLQQISYGAVFDTITKTTFDEIKISLPPLEEQKAIAEVLSSLDDKIDLLHRQNKTLEELAQTLFRQWFIEEADDEWETGILDDIMCFNPTYSLKKGEMYPFLEMGNVQTFKSSVADWYQRSFTSGTKFKNGDTLLARITPSLENGKTAYVDFLNDDEIGWGSTEFVVMRMKENYHPFISYLIARNDDFRDFAIGNMTGSTGRQRAQAKDIKEYEISIPPIDVIQKLNENIEAIPSKIKANSNQIKTLEKIRDTLLPKLMSGEVRIKYDN